MTHAFTVSEIDQQTACAREWYRETMKTIEGQMMMGRLMARAYKASNGTEDIYENHIGWLCYLKMLELGISCDETEEMDKNG